MPRPASTKRTGTAGLFELLEPSTIRVGLPGATKQEVLENLLSLLNGHPVVRDLEEVREAVQAREAVMSTGVGKGLGLPHAKTPAVRDTVAAFAVTQQPVDFGAIDDRPVQLLFLLVGTEEAKSQHIKILSRISRLMNRDTFRRQLLEAQTPEAVLDLFEAAEAQITGG